MPGRWQPRAELGAPQTRWARARDAVARRVREDARWRRRVVAEFHRLYYDGRETTWRNTRWRGVGVNKTPTDLWVYQEVLFSLRPDVIVETGTFEAGSTLYFADLLELAGHGRVVSVDLDTETAYPEHDRITYVGGSSVGDDVVARVRREVEGASTVMVVLDSDHSRRHVAAELDAYHELVTPGSYLVVEDTNINGHPVEADFGPGPHEAVEQFLAEHPDFERDRDCEKFLLTFNPGGWLRRRG